MSLLVGLLGALFILNLVFVAFGPQIIQWLEDR